MVSLRSALLVVLVVAAAALSACGSSNTRAGGTLNAFTSSPSPTSSAATSTPAGSGSGVAAAKQKCLDATKYSTTVYLPAPGAAAITLARARSTAEQACNQITTSNPNLNTALSKAKGACLNAARNIPIASIKQAADTQCNKIAAQ